MDKKQILKELLKSGIMPAPEDLEKINEHNLMQYIASSSRPASGTDQPAGAKPEIRMTVSDGVTGKISSTDLISLYNRKYEILSSILLKKAEATSISNARKVFARSMIIGRVKEMTGRGFLLEDVTGETEVVKDAEGIEQGDVIGVGGYFKDGSMFPEEIIFPDVPLGGAAGNVGGIGIKLSPGPVVSIDDQMTNPIPNPGWVRIERGEEHMVMLVFRPEISLTEQQSIALLHRRLLPEQRPMDVSNIIAEVPDIFWLVGNGKNWARNHKGVVIISTEAETTAVYSTTTNATEFGVAQHS
jgi:hypothetical protein